VIRASALALAIATVLGACPMGGAVTRPGDTPPHGICQAAALVRDAPCGANPGFAFAVVNTSDDALWVRPDPAPGGQVLDARGERVVPPGPVYSPVTPAIGRPLPDGSRMAVLDPVLLLAPGAGTVVVAGDGGYALDWLAAGEYRLEPTFLTPLYAAERVIVYPDAPDEFWAEYRTTDDQAWAHGNAVEFRVVDGPVAEPREVVALANTVLPEAALDSEVALGVGYANPREQPVWASWEDVRLRLEPKAGGTALEADLEDMSRPAAEGTTPVVRLDPLGGYAQAAFCKLGDIEGLTPGEYSAQVVGTVRPYDEANVAGIRKEEADTWGTAPDDAVATTLEFASPAVPLTVTEAPGQ